MILYEMTKNVPQSKIKKTNDDIIGGDRKRTNQLPCKTYDCFQQIDVSRPSLKKIEANMGRAIYESQIPFDIDRKLTDEELEETLNYCAYDVEQTIDVYKQRVNSYFKPKEYLVSMLDKSFPDNAYKWNTTTISSNILVDKSLTKWAWLEVPEHILNLAPAEVVDMWKTKDKGKKVTHEFDNKIEWGFGGLHGVHHSIKEADNVKLLDVGSLYPSIIKNLTHKKVLEDGTRKYIQMIQDRMEAKENGDKERSDALKLILNSVYGNLKNKYSDLLNPNASKTICAYGQCILYELCRRLSHHATIININTDGVAFVPHNNEFHRIWKDWEQEFNFTLELDEFDKWFQRDVNNYIAVGKDGSIKTKGGDTNRYGGNRFFQNNSARILDICLVDYLVYGKDIIDNLQEHLDKPMLFQYVLQAGSTYQGTFDDKGNQYNKVNRVFPTFPGKGTTLYKKREDGGLVMFPDMSNDMYLFNGELTEFHDFKKIINIDHYYQIVLKRLERWG
ncbi:hypothetical protein [Salicibibacter cibarius]|uniref:hypothetical protein n=1 Tax=Salicibibacter cibarius TaxID=2743000 RepID=UPI001FEBFB44|nr:hypothetical protein [Salicibibacter cibarius]